MYLAFLLLIALGLAKVFAFHEVQGFNKWFVLHNIALTLMLGSLATRGLLQLNGADFKGLTYIVGFFSFVDGSYFNLVYVVNKEIV